MRNEYDIIVIGAGHAGCEAAVSAARLGSSVLLITMDMNKIAQMSCNPSIGGIAKGQIIREIDALGGFSGIITDASTLQFRMLNRSKGPAMWSPRAQCDRIRFSYNWRFILENTCKLDIWQDSAISLSLSGSHICGVSTSLGAKFKSKAVIITAGTFLNGKIFIGSESVFGGRVGEPSSLYISDQLSDLGIPTHRMKTGTPPRIDIRSIDLSKLEIQYGDSFPDKFSYLNYLSPIQNGCEQKVCYIAHTNSTVHDILRASFNLSPLFSGKITGRGPRYCPSIEDKIKTFADKDQHQLFLEPEGWETNEYYLQGFSSSLPLETQLAALSNVSGFEQAKIYRPAYAIEYDYFDPTFLKSSLESKIIDNLFLAGQVNGTTGYEEAAAQGLIAGINAHLIISGQSPLVLSRDQSYIGVLIDDLVTKGVDEPYRMFTSRAEYRILLRQDDADKRLTELSHSMGLADDYRYELCMRKYSQRDALIDIFENNSVKPETINSFLSRKGSSPISYSRPLSSLITRPEISLKDLSDFVPRGTMSDFKDSLSFKHELLPLYALYSAISLPCLPLNSKVSIADSSDLFYSEILTSAEILLKYSGYIDRESKMASKIKHLESINIPLSFDYSKVTSLSYESRQKLILHRPSTIAQASRIPGVSPSDISVLLVYFGR